MTTLDFGPLVLGGNPFGWGADRDQSFAVLDAFVAGGGRAIDTADAYIDWIPGNDGGESETIIGEWMASRRNRDQVLIATKVAKWKHRRGLAAENIRAAVDDSLRRLQTDHIDLYYAHEDDGSVEQREYVEAFSLLVAGGKVRELGASNFDPDRLRSAVEIAEDGDLVPFTVSQDPLNLVERRIESELLPTVRDLGLVELPYHGLASGFLTGKYAPGADVDSTRSGRASSFLDDPRAVGLLDAARAIAADRGVEVAAVALAWVRQQPGVAAPIASARRPEQLVALQQSYGLELSDEELAALA